jgi:hypothetical protein
MERLCDAPSLCLRYDHLYPESGSLNAWAKSRSITSDSVTSLLFDIFALHALSLDLRPNKIPFEKLS